MLEELDKIDAIRARTGISFREAKKLLDEADGDVVQALMKMEEKEGPFTEKLQSGGQDLLEHLKNALKKGHHTKIKVKQGDRIVFEIPATAGAVGLLAALASSELAVLGALGAVTAMAKKYTLEFEQQEGKPAKQEEG